MWEILAVIVVLLFVVGYFKFSSEFFESRSDQQKIIDAIAEVVKNKQTIYDYEKKMGYIVPIRFSMLVDQYLKNALTVEMVDKIFEETAVFA